IREFENGVVLHVTFSKIPKKRCQKGLLRIQTVIYGLSSSHRFLLPPSSSAFKSPDLLDSDSLLPRFMGP
ncbi:unnamed protein product, partial [Brassica oleracea]